MKYPDAISIDFRVRLKLIIFLIFTLIILIISIMVPIINNKKFITTRYIEYSNDINNPIVEIGTSLKITTNKELLIQANIIKITKEFFFIQIESDSPFENNITAYASPKIISIYEELLTTKFYDPTPIKKLPDEYIRTFRVKKIKKENDNIYTITGTFIEQENFSDTYITLAIIIINFSYLTKKEIAGRINNDKNFNFLNPFNIKINNITINI